jgi:hypothetical protein
MDLLINLRRISILFWGENTNVKLGRIIWNQDGQMSVAYSGRKR